VQTIVHVLDFGLDLSSAVDAPRFHHQGNPDHLVLELGRFPADLVTALRGRGYRIETRTSIGSVQAIHFAGDGLRTGFSDLRRGGLAAGE
jgi:gamma-glutamyltranspeptidase/glutathione hydrolase